MDTKAKLKSVVYSRNVNVERNMAGALIGESRWLRDIELLIEDNWQNVKLHSLEEAKEQVKALEYGLALVEGTSNIETVRSCIESVVPQSVSKVILLNEEQNPLIKRNFINYAARGNLKVLELPKDEKAAAAELNELLSNLFLQVRTALDEDVEKLETILNGFTMNGAVSNLRYHQWEQKCAKLVNWIGSAVALSSSDLKLVKTLLRAEPINAFRQQWSSDVSEVVLPLEGFAKSIKVYEYIDLGKALALMNWNNSTQEGFVAEIEKSKLGILLRRTLKNNVSRLTEVVQEVKKVA